VLELARRAATVYRRFRRHRLRTVMGPVALAGPAGDTAGYLERVTFAPTGIEVEGWTRWPTIRLACGTASETVVPTLPRSDVPDAPMGPGHGFIAHLSAGDGPVIAEVEISGGTAVTTVAPPGPARRVRAEGRVVWLFLSLLVRQIPNLRAYLVGGNQDAGNALRSLSGLFGDDRLRRLAPDLFGDAPPDPQSDGSTVVVVVPVYGGVRMVQGLLDRLSTEASRHPYRVVIIDDASPEPEIVPMLRGVRDRQPDRFELIECAENAGFVAAANLGLARAAELDAHAVILNSDALPPRGWLDRLLGPILRDPAIASVTPFSNDAEILSVPRASHRMPLAEGAGDRIDTVARRFRPDRAEVPVPVGIGFCMAMNRRFLRHIPAFDPAFGRGYGEEVDWCRKATALGGRHLGLAGLFVPHIGGASFGSAEKQARVARNNALVARRHPVHDAEVQRFLEDDPAFDHRFVLALAHAGAETEVAVPILLGHSLGGGAERWLQATVRGRAQRGEATVVLRAGGPTRWRIELHRPEAVLTAAAQEDRTAIDVLSCLERRRVVYSCGVGAADPRALVDVMMALSDGPGQSAEVLFHDFYPLSPNYTLLGPSGVFEGVPAADDTAALHAWPGLPGLSPAMSLADWRAMWRPVLDRAERLRAFSRDSARHVLAAYPTVADRLEILPHGTGTTVVPAAPPGNGRRVIGILGDLNRAKGAEVVQDLSHWLSRDPRGPRLAHIGNIDPSYRLARGHVGHGAYRLDELGALIARYGIGCWLMPSVWPETFSFTTHEMLATGLPVFCFPLGAQAETVAQASNGHVLSALTRDPEAFATEILARMAW
jgi:GT2 family glycosyltransferase